MLHPSKRPTVIAGVVIAALAVGGTAAQSGDITPAAAQRRVDDAVASAVRYLAAQIGPDGLCKGEFDEQNNHYGGKTALCAYALLAAGVDPDQEPLKRALKWLTQAELRGTYAVATRACALALVKGRKPHPQLLKDAAWLQSAAADDGSYTYTSVAKGDQGRYDNSNSQMAAMGVWAAAQRGVKVPREYWRRTERHWKSQQQVDGGWGYVMRPGLRRTSTYGSMTAAGLATMYICFDVLHRDRYVRPTARPYGPIADGLKWMDKYYAADHNPRKGVNYYYYWLFCLARASLASGHKHFASRDWYAQCLQEVLERQNGDGSWGSGDGIRQTAFALLFLSHGRQPVLINKLRYKGKWNVRPRDLAGFTRYIHYTFERGVSWQAVDLGAPVEQWYDAPILYISGAGRVEFTDKQIQKLRTFAGRGGLIVSEAAGNSGAFTLDMHKTYKSIYPNLRLRRLPSNHPIYTSYFAPKSVTGLWGVSNGIRLLAIHAPRELSLALQNKAQGPHRAVFELLANIYILTTDKGALRPRGSSPWPPAKAFTPKATIRVARVKYAGNYDPEPMAWKRLAIIMGNRHGIKLEVAGPMPIAALDAAKYPVAAMAGTDEFKLTSQEQQALKKYLTAGGTLIIDAAGGSKAFADAIGKQIVPLVPNGRHGRLASWIAYNGPEKIDRVYYRRQFAMMLGRDKKDHRLRCVLIGRDKPSGLPGGLTDGGRVAVIYSPEDLTAGLLGYPAYAIRGYRPDSAVALMTNLLYYAAGVANGAGGLRTSAASTGSASSVEAGRRQSSPGVNSP